MTSQLVGARVLIIDDSVDNRFFLSRWLEDEGVHVTEAETGAQGLELSRDVPDLIICDVRLPDMSGLDVTAAIKADPVTNEIPVIQRSSVDIDDSARVEGLSSGADSYLIEPIDRRLLVATLTAMLRFRDVSRQLEAALAIDVTGVFDWNVDADHVRWSESLERIHGLKVGSFGGSFVAFLQTVHPGDRERINAEVGTAMTEDDSIDIAFRFLRADGATGWMEARGSVFRDSNGRATRLLGLAHDVTDRMIERTRVDQLRRLAGDLNAARTVPKVLDVVRAEVEAAGIEVSWSESSRPVPDDVAFSFLAEDHRFDLIGRPADPLMAERQLIAIGELAGGALDRAQRYEHERNNAVTFQRALLPVSTPDVDGWRLDSQYVPATAGDRLGGDFYDVIELDQLFVIVLGDVAGHGLEATKHMGTMRTMLRTLACSYDGQPTTVLERAAELFAGVCGPDAPFVTTVVASFSPDGRVEVATAGHPPPLLRASGGPALLQLEPSPPLGVTSSISPVGKSYRMVDGDWMVFYTDGVFEGRSESVDVSAERAGCELGDHPTASDVVAAGERSDDLNHDDRAVVVVERTIAGG